MANPVSLQAINPPTAVASVQPAVSQPLVTQPTARRTAANTDGSAPVASAAAAPTKTSPNAGPDTVKISNAGQSALAESRETPTQTTKEAAHGDRQAIKLLAKQAAARAASIG